MSTGGAPAGGRRLLAAPDKFRGSASAPEVARAMARAATAAGWSCVELPLADGGEGTLEAFGGGNRTARVTGPHGRPVEAAWQLDDDGTAVVESALASGLALAGGAAGNDPMAATTRGTGELIAAALEEGARRVVVSLGGSATTDGGLGAVDVLEAYAPFGVDGRSEVLVACDVRTPFCDAATVFGPQKGATPTEVLQLTDRLRALAIRYRERFGVDVARIEGAGAAGGLGGGLAALGARLVPGFPLIAEHTGLDAALRTADAVVTGEGRLDAESFNGKVVGGVLELAAQSGVPVLVVAGVVADEVAGRVTAVSLVDRFGEEASWRDPLDCVTRATTEWLRGEGTAP